MRNNNVAVWSEGALMIALAVAMEFIPHVLFGFTIGFSAIPIIIFAFRRGMLDGIIAGIIWGLLDLAYLGQILNPVQAILEYPVACGIVGISGILAARMHHAVQDNNIKNVIILSIWGSAIAMFGKFFIHFIAGVVFWGSYAPKNLNPFTYSMIVNGISGLLSFIVVAVVISIIGAEYPKFYE